MDKSSSFIPKPVTMIPKLRNDKKEQLVGGLTKPKLRRSKSVSDIRTVRNLELKKPTFSHFQPTLRENAPSTLDNRLNKQINRDPKNVRRSKSTTNLSSGTSTTSGKINNIRKPLVVTKRPLPTQQPNVIVTKRAKPEEKTAGQKENKTVTRKPPSYDYKSRFNLLNDKHLTLRSSHTTLKQEFEQTQNELANIKQDYSSLLPRIDELEKDRINLKLIETKYETITKEKDVLERENERLLQELKNTREAHTILQKEYDLSTKTIELTRNTLTEKTAQLESTLQQLKECKNELYINEGVRRELHNRVQDLKGNIRVFCRIRPALSTEDDKVLCNINYIDEATLELKGRENQKNEFTFDKVFPPESTQIDLFEDMAGLVQSALDGYHVCVFAYGQTGSGKTYTMQGESTSFAQGMIPRSMELLFESIKRLQKVGWEYKVEASFLEIYNETIRDLLAPLEKNHDIKFNDGKGVIVTNLKIEAIESVEEFKNLMAVAGKNRAVAATNFNEHSSRSHAVTKIYINGVNKDFKVSYMGSLNLIDLAGSESAKTSSDERIKETKNINRSLSALGNVILALHQKENHIPFRNSKLTYLLQSCLAGNSKTLMVVNVSPFEECYNETINSLRFAFKVKGVKVSSRRNKVYIT